LDVAPATKKQRTKRIKIEPPLYLNPRVRIERRNGSPRLYARVFIDGKCRVKSTGAETIGAAMRQAEKFYLDLLIARRAGYLPTLPVVRHRYFSKPRTSPSSSGGKRPEGYQLESPDEAQMRGDSFLVNLEPPSNRPLSSSVCPVR
jgi:hypothetical protein